MDQENSKHVGAKLFAKVRHHSIIKLIFLVHFVRRKYRRKSEQPQKNNNIVVNMSK